jgi:hypothetical protein
VVERGELGDRPAHRHADDVRGTQIEGADDADCVGDEVRGGVRRSARLVADRLPGVAVVVADDEPAAGLQPRAEGVLPPVHRRARAHDEQDRRVGRVTERLDAELDTVDAHLIQDRPRPRNSSVGCG